ncbi:MAG: thiol peroxidase [Clostridia bacterium]|nr:thiol peroxidase [Clostridia bacterium]
MAQERPNAFGFGGGLVTLIGPALKPGDIAPDFRAVATDLSEKRLGDFAGKVRLIASVPSLDTPVCDQETRRFNQEATGLGEDVVVLVVSMDLPFAQKRWCGAAGVDRVVTLSDHRDASFGEAYGVLIKGHRLLSRAVFVVGRDGRLTYVEYVPSAPEHPRYEEVLAAVRSALA